jgi:hypothetical protein
MSFDDEEVSMALNPVQMELLLRELQGIREALEKLRPQ